MRITAVLNRQHIGFMFKKHWHIKGKRNVEVTSAATNLLAHGITPKDPNEYFNEMERIDRIIPKVDSLFEEPLPLDETHPEYQQDGVYVFNDSNVLVQGVQQAQVLLKTAIFEEFPQKVEEAFQNLKLPSDVERSMQQSVLVSHLLDAEQQKTVKIVNPLRPMRPYPRNYGITEARKNLLLSTRLLNHCERFQGHIKASERKIINDAFFVAAFTKGNAKLQAELTAEVFVSSRKPIASFNMNAEANAQELPDIFPLAPTVSIPKTHFYKKNCAFPINPANKFSHPHTIMLHYSNLDVKNLYEEPVTAEQFESRAMMKGFATAASRAQSLYGTSVKDLEKPIVVQVVQLETNRIQFGIFQLNTLDLNSNEGMKNYWFRKPAVSLYDECFYNAGRPALRAYNFDVFRLMNVFYNN